MTLQIIKKNVTPWTYNALIEQSRYLTTTNLLTFINIKIY